jgi:hypothetical protein
MRKALVLAAVAALCVLATAPAQARKMSTTYTTSLTPKTATNPTGVNHTLTATVIRHTENCDPDPQTPQIEPAQGVTVKFEVVSGPNAGLSGTDTTDAQGHAQFIYTSQTPGTDKLIATPMALQNKGICNAEPGPAGPSDAVEAIWVKSQGGGETDKPCDDGPPPTVTINDVRVKEGDSDWSPATPATFTVSLSKPSSVPITVEFATVDGTATDAWDYAKAHDKLTFNPGDPLTQPITISVRGDRLTEHDEWFAVNLSNPTNVLIADGMGIGTIVDDDPLPQS